MLTSLTTSHCSLNTRSILVVSAALITQSSANRAKRYERMMKAHGIHQSAASIRDTPIASRRRNKDAKSDSTKKRKADQFADENNNTTGDDDEGLGKIKDEPVKKTVKKETEVKVETPLSDGFFQYPTNDGDQRMSIDGNSMFATFLHSGAFEQEALQSHTEYDNGINPSAHDCAGDVASSASGNGLQESILIAD